MSLYSGYCAAYCRCCVFSPACRLFSCNVRPVNCTHTLTHILYTLCFSVRFSGNVLDFFFLWSFLPNFSIICIFLRITLGLVNSYYSYTPTAMKWVFFTYYACALFAGRPEPTVTWFNGSESIHTAGGVAMGRHVIVNRLEIPNLTRDAYNSTLRCQAMNTKLAPPVERVVKLDMLRKFTCFEIIWPTMRYTHTHTLFFSRARAQCSRIHTTTSVAICARQQRSSIWQWQYHWEQI